MPIQAYSARDCVRSSISVRISGASRSPLRMIGALLNKDTSSWRSCSCTANSAAVERAVLSRGLALVGCAYFMFYAFYLHVIAP